MTVIAVLVIIFVLAGIYLLWASSQCQDNKGIVFFMMLAIVSLLLANVIGVLGIVYKLGGM